VSDVSDRYLQIQSVTKSFGAETVVDDFDLNVAQGEFVSLLGPSGCGKTTLLRMIAGLEFPDAGAVLLEGKDITDVPPHKRPVNTVFQRVTLFPHLNVRENVTFGLRLRHVPKGEARRLVDDALGLVRLPDFGDRAVRTLSGGQAQRVALARAIVNRPKVLLLDEPLSALDLLIRRELQVQLKEIHRELHGTFVYVTHDQEEALGMSDRVVVMDRGRIMQACGPKECYREPASSFVASFVGTGNVLRGTLAESNGRLATVSVDGVPLQGASPSHASPGDPVALVLRSEAVQLIDPSTGTVPDGLCSIRGTVATTLFVGSVINYRIDVGARRLTASCSSRDEGAGVREGDEVLIAWRPEDAPIVKDIDPQLQTTGAAEHGKE
jgi:ABC-type Fe3+/spermidine/putrescine transport system ATPase subunit